jgi:outer membrane protein OmpA-like peptidoglycan-associated protein/tetratricopeptide (TPR) repeat protein
MKNIYIVLCFVFLGTTTFKAQNAATKAADKHFARFEYVAAVKEYLKIAESENADSYINKQLAESYFNMFNTIEAAKWYERLIKEPQDAETYYRYAQMLKANGKYELANKQMSTFASKAPNDQRAKTFLANPNYLPKLLDKPKGFSIKGLTINSDKSEFGAILTNENILYFTSARNKAKRNDGWNDEPFLDIYQSVQNSDGSFSIPTEVSDLNTKWHDGPIAVTADGKTAYFSRDGFSDTSNKYATDKKLNAKFSQIGLYKAVKEDGKWTKIVPLPINSKTYSNSNPSVSKDGKTLFFTSNMPGGIGDTDIWKVSVGADNTYGTPENLGAKVNTEGKEQFAFITDDNVLYFSSSARQGLGGLDVFSVDLKSNQKAENLGKPVNSEKDDFAFSFNTTKNQGFFSSNRAGNDDIFTAEPVCSVTTTTIVTNLKTGQTLSGARVAILDEKKNTIQTKITAENGEVEYIVDCNTAYSLQVAKDGYESNVFAVAKTKSGVLSINAGLNPIDVIVTEKEIILNEINFDFDQSNITQAGAFELDKLVQVMQNNEKLVILVKSHTDNKGSDQYNLLLSDRRAKSTVQYVISKGIAENRISGKGYGESEPKIDCKENCTDEDTAKNRRSEFLIVK